MGWTFTTRRHGESMTEFFKQEFFTSGQQELLALRVVNMREAYGAVREPDGRVWALVCLLDFVPHRGFNIGYKDMDESMGPNADRCPQDILDLLTPTDSQWANEWRDRCRARLAKRSITFKVGDVVEFNEAVEFANHVSYSTFYVKSVKPWRVSDGAYTTLRVTRDWLRNVISQGGAKHYDAAGWRALTYSRQRERLEKLADSAERPDLAENARRVLYVLDNLAGRVHTLNASVVSECLGCDYQAALPLMHFMYSAGLIEANVAGDYSFSYVPTDKEA